MMARAPWLSRLLVAACLASAALVPLLNPQLPRSADGRPHLFRIILLDNAIRNGEWWPRYSPELAYGNGYPLFNFYAPLTYYLGVVLHRMGLEFVPALHAIFALTLIIGAWGAFTLAAEWFGEWAAGVAAAAFVFAPYTLFNTLTRGAAPEALAVALLPWLLWSLHYALRAPSALALLRLSLLYAALLLTHNLTALIGTGMLSVWTLVELWAVRPRFTRPLSLVTLSLLCGLALAAFFWLPALFETSAVQVAQLTAPATLDFRNYFLSFAQLLTPTFTFDPRLEPVSVPVSFGVVNTVFAVLALLLWRRYPNHTTRWRIAALGALCAVFLWMALPASQPVWEALGVLRVIQFPWRFLGPASVLAALLCGAAVSALGERVARWLAPVLIVVLALLAFPWTFVTRYSETQLPASPRVTDIFAYEVESGGFGLTSTGEFLPVGVKVLPPPDAARAAAAAAAQGAFERLDVASLPDSVTVRESTSSRLAADARFQSPQPFTATFRWFDFPGWQAEVDGQRVEIAPSEPHGFITVPVPAGEHSVHVFFGTTPVRQIAATLSTIGILAILVMAAFAYRQAVSDAPTESVTSRITLYASLLTLGLSLALFRFAIDARDTPFRQSRFDGQNVAGAEQSLDVNFGDALRLVAFDPPPPTPADQPLAFTLYWTQFDAVNTNYSIAAQLWDEEGHLIGQQDSQHPNGAPTTRWLAGGYATDRHALTPYPGTPPGEYRLVIGVYPEGGALRGANVEVKNAAGLPLGRFFEAARVTVLPPAQPATIESLNPAQVLHASLGPIELIGVDGLRPNVTAGDDLPLVLYYRVNETLIPNTFLQLDLRSADAGEAKLRTLTPMSAITISGNAGAVVRMTWTFLIPARTPPGVAEVQASVYGLSRGRIAGPVSLGNVTVAVPPRSFVAPPMPSTVNVRFGSAIELLGFEMTDTPRPGESLALTLYWQSHEAVAARYTVFVHVRDAYGNIVAQTDALPAQGTRPTTGWLPPEIITDMHSIPLPLDLPAGEYLVQVGLYDPRTGDRLKVLGADGSEQGDAVVLGKIESP